MWIAVAHLNLLRIRKRGHMLPDFVRVNLSRALVLCLFGWSILAAAFFSASTEPKADARSHSENEVNRKNVDEQSEMFWTDDLRLSLGNRTATQPVLCAWNNEIYSVWSDDRTKNRELFLRVSRDGGLTWDAEERITVSIADSVWPALACDRRYVHLVWEERSETDSAIWYMRWDGTRWSPTQILSSETPRGAMPGAEGLRRDDTAMDAFRAQHPDIAVTTIAPGSMVYVVWESTQKTRTVAYLSRSVNSGEMWSTPLPITSNEWNTRAPRVAGGIRTAYVVWRDEREPTGNIFVKRWGEVVVGADIRLSVTGDCHHPDVSVLEPQVVVAWEARSGEIAPADIFAAHSYDSGRTWRRAQQVTQTTAESTLPRIMVFMDDSWLFWQDGQTGNWEIFLSTRTFYQKNWSQPERFTQTDIDSIMPVVTNSSAPDFRISTRKASLAHEIASFLATSEFRREQIHLLWIERKSETESYLVYKRRDTIPPLPPSKPLHLDMNAPAGYDNDDTLTFIWEVDSFGDREEPKEHPSQYNVYITTSLTADISAEQFQLAGSTTTTFIEFSADGGKTYRVAVAALDAVGNESEWSELSEPVTVDSQAPVALIHLPLPVVAGLNPVTTFDYTTTSSTPVIITCQDDNLVEWRLQYGETIAPAAWTLLVPPSKFTVARQRVTFWDVSQLAGVYTLVLVAVDEAGNQSLTEIPIVIDNRPPMPIISGAQELLVTSDMGANYRTPAWSPDGTMVAYASNESGAEDIWLINIANHNRIRLTRDIDVDSNPVWSPDAQWLAFQSLTDENWDIKVIKTDGSEHEPSTLIEDVAMDTAPAWSPSGRQLAFSSNRDGDREIWLLTNVDEVFSGSNPHFVKLTRNKWGEDYPTWSPDETQIAFQSDRHGNWDIFRINIDGSQETRLTESLDNEVKPKWSPDGKRILFISDPNSGAKSSEIRAISVDGSEIITLSPPDVDVRHADWSPDLTGLVYQSESNLYLMDFRFPEPALEARITHPYAGEYLNGTVDIIGIARGTDFQAYRLEYAVLGGKRASARNYPENWDWKPIGGTSTAQVSQIGFLGRVDINALQVEAPDFIEGEYLLRLVVTGEDGSSVDDIVNVMVEHQRPQLVVTDPPDGLITDTQLILVEGYIEEGNKVTINGEHAPLIPDETSDQWARFAVQLLLKDGENHIVITARSPLGSETTVRRDVVLDTHKLTITMEAPDDFAIVDVPYVTVAGSIDKSVQTLKILDTFIAVESNGRFQRTIFLRDGVNLITVEAVDFLGRVTQVQRRVICEKPAVIRKDVHPPAITNVLPPHGTTIADAKPEISAILVDDVQIDPETITLTFDDIEIEPEQFEFTPDSGTFRYIPKATALEDGEHTFIISVQDTAENAAESTVTFTIDTAPLEMAVSAFLTEFNPIGNAVDNNSWITVILASNKRLSAVSMATIWISDFGFRKSELNPKSDIGYSLNLDLVEGVQTPPFRYEGVFEAAPFQHSFIFDVLTRDAEGKTFATQGYFAWSTLSPGASAIWGSIKGSEQDNIKISSAVSAQSIGIPGIVEAIFPATALMPLPQIVLRSQDGLDIHRLTAQRQDAQARDLEPIGIVHLVETQISNSEIRNPKSGGEDMTFILKLPMPAETDQFALFHWDVNLQRWNAVDAIRMESQQTKQIIATVNQLGAYALLIDETPPTITRLYPEDHTDVPLERFLVEAEVYDGGSGIAADRIELQIDDEPAAFSYELLTSHLSTGQVERSERGRIIYLPSDIDPGRHTLQLSVQDRAYNIATISSVFFTRDIFDFAENIIGYPCPANTQVTFVYKLTKTADVTLEIYSVSGELIYTDYRKNSVGRTGEQFIWMCENQAHEPVANGVYIYIIEAQNANGQKARRSGKIAVVK